MSGNKTCDSYTGITCILGGCPVLGDPDENRRRVKHKQPCKNCIYNKGCDDCYFATETGCRLENATVATTNENSIATIKRDGEKKAKKKG